MPEAALLQSALVKLYGEQVAREFSLIESMLHKESIARSVELGESDLDIFCRRRQAKLNLHAQQGADEYFDPVRLLNMLYEGCLIFLRDAADYFGSGDAVNARIKIDKAERIINNFIATLDHKKGGSTATELFRLYDFSLEHLAEAKKEGSRPKTMEVYRVIENIYLGYLEVEIRYDAKEMLEAKKAKTPKKRSPKTPKAQLLQ